MPSPTLCRCTTLARPCGERVKEAGCDVIGFSWEFSPDFRIDIELDKMSSYFVAFLIEYDMNQTQTSYSERWQYFQWIHSWSMCLLCVQCSKWCDWPLMRMFTYLLWRAQSRHLMIVHLHVSWCQIVYIVLRYEWEYDVKNILNNMYGILATSGHRWLQTWWL